MGSRSSLEPGAFFRQLRCKRALAKGNIRQARRRRRSGSSNGFIPLAAGSSADSLSPRLLPFLLAAAQPCFLLENIWAVGSELRPAGGFPHAPYTPWVGLGGTRCWWLDPLG